MVLPVLISCASDRGQEDGFTINGSIDGVKDGKAVLSKLALVTNQRVDVDQSTIHDGKFSFSGRSDHPQDEVSDAFGVKAVPQNFLLDPSGIIIAKNIEPNDLAVKLHELLPEQKKI